MRRNLWARGTSREDRDRVFSCVVTRSFVEQGQAGRTDVTMFIGVCGSICAGKRTIARYLVDHHGFTQLFLDIRASDGVNDGTDGVVFPSNSNGSPYGSDSPPNPQHIFSAPGDLLDFVTKHWRERWVTTDIHSEAILDLYARRPFFLLLSVDAPLTVRWRRYQARQQQLLTTTTAAGAAATKQKTFESFVALSDGHLYDPARGAHPLLSRASVRLLNTSDSLAHLHAALGGVDLLARERLRPSWDAYFMALASLAAQRSNCMKRRVGCVVVRDKRVISTGYNGTPRGLPNCGEGGCARCNAGDGSGHGLATCLCIHAEENALLEAGRERLRDGAVLYCDTCPCLTCSIKIVQVGVGEVVYNHGYSMDGDTAAVFREAGVKLRQFVPPANGLIHLERLE
ncbi:cytidine deaminase-like protein [Chaetomium fimeti]|uniref:Deoxycytidylate deaminase n=1 Tax=Chaetomium fimeti TaxID=1854472 RepID=A0AAE0HRS7_9PEZI|nr:cytidine deaminase-like protein [Chaetomium fimeti]